jgi:hypothetical protein
MMERKLGKVQEGSLLHYIFMSNIIPLIVGWQRKKQCKSMEKLRVMHKS